MSSVTRPSKELLMIAHAMLVSRMSTCSRLQVGAVLTDERFEQIASGYNGAARGLPNECLHPDAQGSCGCVHAENNAAIKARFVPTRAFVTDSPCPTCAAVLVNCGIRELYYARPYRLDEGLQILSAGGVRVVRFDLSDLHDELWAYFGVDVTSDPYDWSI